MKLHFKQRVFAWFDGYDVWHEDGSVAYTVQGRLSWGHLLEIHDAMGTHLGSVKEEIFTLLPRFALYEQGEYIGSVKRQFTLFFKRFELDCEGWTVEGDLFDWDYTVRDSAGNLIMTASKELFRWTDTYVLDIADPRHALRCLMIVLAIDAAACSHNNS